MLLSACWTAVPILAQARMPGGTTKPADDLVSLNFPENLELKLLVEYVSQRLGINFIYDEQIVAQRITLKTPTRVPASSLLSLLDSALRMKGATIVDGEQAGWKKIVPANNLAANAVPATQPGRGEARPGLAVTQVFPIRYADVTKLETMLRPFLTQPGGNAMPIPEQRILILTDFASNMSRLSNLIATIDRPPQEAAVQFVALQHTDAAQLASQVTQILTAKRRTGLGGNDTMSDVEISADARTNQLLIIGVPEHVAEAAGVIASLDVPVATETRLYPLTSVTPERLDRLARQLVDPSDGKRLYQSAIDRESNTLVVTASPAVHERVTKLKNDLDVPTKGEQSPVRFYKLTNTTAADVLATIRAIEGQGFSAVLVEGSSPASRPSQISEVPGANRPPPEVGQELPKPPSYQGLNDRKPSDSVPAFQAGQQSVKTELATVTADTNTNTIIVVADPQTQGVYQRLIEMLDKRRPQVLIEATLVTIDTSDSFSLAVEVGIQSGIGDVKFLNFSSFGISTVNNDTGQLSVTPGIGFNGAIINQDTASLVIRALKTHGRARVLSAPKILVNDNATGTLESISESPFTSINASDTVSTTSFGGYASAGTSLTLTPHISEGEHLHLEYAITLSSFTGASANGIPPPRQTNTLASEVTVPDGHTVVIGGINRDSESSNKSAIPWLGEIPILEYLFSSRSSNTNRSTLFVFLRPIVLRDDQFKDLRFYSERDGEAAGIPGDYPKSEPLLLQ